MSDLRRRMAEFGFESNERYDYVVRCLTSAPGPALRCLNIEGEGGRRKTAFATALAHALEPSHVVYHDFSQSEPEPAPEPASPEGGPRQPPVGRLDRAMSDVCAFSEADKTVLILDQLHQAEFKTHIRLWRFLVSHEWRYGDAVFYANRNNLFVFLISEEPLYHALQKNSFKVWVAGGNTARSPYTPEELGLPPQAAPLLEALHEAFETLGAFPTESEYRKILHDIERNVRSIDDLKQSIYGWTESVDRERLNGDAPREALAAVMRCIEDYLGVEEVELGPAPEGE
ncbi:MAG: hypothetical protein KatS3mg121_1035 [Gammaproteobacteria bacterium]|nr:MAG: hypothetical protein KatS3mg121_1035 [Gammaproteobacteria bacterium]